MGRPVVILKFVPLIAFVVIVLSGRWLSQRPGANRGAIVFWSTGAIQVWGESKSRYLLATGQSMRFGKRARELKPAYLAESPYDDMRLFIPMHLIVVALLPLLVGPIIHFRFPLWSWFAYTALVAVEVAHVTDAFGPTLDQLWLLHTGVGPCSEFFSHPPPLPFPSAGS